METNGVSPVTPALQDEADVLEEVGAERDEETGELRVSEETVKEVGALDAESVRENRRLSKIVDKKRGNVKNVSFNTGDTLSTYDTMLKTWGANTIDINVRRLTGSPVQHVIISRPRSGTELYTALMAFHGQYEIAEYEVNFIDNATKQYRAKTRITMPDTRTAAQQGQPMNPYYPNPYAASGYPPPHGYPPPPGYPPQPPAVAAPAPHPQQPPVVVHAPGAPDMQQMMTSFQQMFDLFRTMQAQATPPSMAPQQQPPIVMPPAGPDMGSMMAWFQQMLEMARSMQPPGAPAANGQSSQGPSPINPMLAAMMGGGGMAAPPIQPPAGTVWVPSFGFVPIDALMRAACGPEWGGRSSGGGGATMGPPRGPRPQYYPQGEPGALPRAQEPPPRQKTAAEQFEEALGTIRTAVRMVENVNRVLPGAIDTGASEPQTSPDVDDDSPIKMIDTGAAKIIVDKKDGHLRMWETAWANSDKMLNWASEQTEKIRKMNSDRAEKQRAQERPQLPAGYVEVTEGYVPPPGFVPVPVDQSGQPLQSMQPQRHSTPLAPPPVRMPPPIQSQPQTQTWTMPAVTEGD